MTKETPAPEPEKPTGLALLRLPFPPHQISKLPKEAQWQIDERKQKKNAINCKVCGGYHHKDAVHLDYVGHAALTDRLLDADPMWSWEPMAYAQDGSPAIVNGGMWIKLTVCGMTRLGYGHAGNKQGGDAIKEIIGDALRNAAMRFGAALDLWHKGDLHAPEDEGEPAKETGDPDASPALVAGAIVAMELCHDADALNDWVKTNQAAIAKMCEGDKDQIRKAIRARKASFAKEPAREIFE